MIVIKDAEILTNPRPEGITHCDRCKTRLDGRNGGTVEYSYGTSYVTRYFLCGLCHSECQRTIDAFVKENDAE